MERHVAAASGVPQDMATTCTQAIRYGRATDPRVEGRVLAFYGMEGGHQSSLLRA